MVPPDEVMTLHEQSESGRLRAEQSRPLIKTDGCEARSDLIPKGDGKLTDIFQFAFTLMQSFTLFSFLGLFEQIV